MSDLYTEVLVKKQQTGKDKAIKGVLIFFTVLFAAAGIMMNPLILLLALVLWNRRLYFYPEAFGRVWSICTSTASWTSTASIRSQEEKEPQAMSFPTWKSWRRQSHQLDSYKNNQSIKRYNYSGIEGQGHKPYAFVISKDNAMQMVIFEPDEVMLKDIRNRAPRKVFMD